MQQLAKRILNNDRTGADMNVLRKVEGTSKYRE